MFNLMDEIGRISDSLTTIKRKGWIPVAPSAIDCNVRDQRSEVVGRN